MRALRPALEVAVLFLAVCLLTAAGANGQAVTTATVHGTVRSADGASLDGARITIVNVGTGFRLEGQVRLGRFLLGGLETGGPYTITVHHPGYHAGQRDGVYLALGEPLVLHFVLRPAAIPLDTLRVVPESFPETSPDGGTATTIADSVLHRMPSLNRDLYDFVRLVPQISTRTGFRTGFSGGGVGLRYNNYLINGVPERSDYYNATPAFAGGKSLSLEAVREYQVLVSPYDVRYGEFAGAMVNTVTRTGTNRFQGSVFAYGRNDQLARRGAGQSPYDRVQYGADLGGPIVRDRLHFFITSEFQHLTTPALGPWVGQPASAGPVPVSAADVERFGELLRAKGLEAGTGGPVENGNPLTNVFARVDYAIPAWNSRASLWSTYDRTASSTFSRLAADDTFPLSTYQLETVARRRITSLQLQTAFGRAGAHNELTISHNDIVAEGRSSVRQPVVRVSVPGATGGTAMLVAGTHPQADGSGTRTRILRVDDNLMLPLDAGHALSLGVSAGYLRVVPGGVAGSYGAWTFSSLDSLELGVAERFEIPLDLGSARIPIEAMQYALYAGDEWRAGERVVLTLGLRGDLLAIRGHAPYNREVDSIFGRRTDDPPPRAIQWSPRVGFTWALDGAGRDRLRGGLGIFAGQPPAVWYHDALSRYGVGIGRLTCGARAGDADVPPPFVPDVRSQPTSCAGGSSPDAPPRGDVDLLHPDLKEVRILRSSIAWDRHLPWDLLATAEAMYTRNLADLVFVNLNLAGPQATDRHGRVLYGAIPASGIAEPVLRSPFPEVIELANTSRGHSWQLSARVEKRFARGTGLTASYTWSRVRDVSTPVRTAVRGTVNWSARAVSGRHDDTRPGISLNDVPHRIVLAGTWRAPWRRWSTELSFYYVGESGGPFTWIAGGAGGRGDLNADGSNANDPVYVPQDARDPSEIRFAGGSQEEVRAQQEELERLIEHTPCLREQRGRIMARNSCRNPWTHTTAAAVRQAIPLAGRHLEAELQAFNLLNLLNADWGLYRVAGGSNTQSAAVLVEHVEQQDGEPVFRLRTPSWTATPESRFQLQVGLRYRF